MHCRSEKTKQETTIFPIISAIAKYLQTNRNGNTPEMTRVGILFPEYWHLWQGMLLSVMIDISVSRHRH